jgi:hypothetical protein
VATIWRTRDRLGREVALTEGRRDHILSKHPELAGRLGEARATVEGPDFVTRDAADPRREHHYRRTPSGRAWIKVVVNERPVPPQGTWAGEVITAYRTERVDPEEAPLWP